MHDQEGRAACAKRSVGAGDLAEPVGDARHLTQDGQSTSQITIFARDANGQPLRSLSLRADIMVNDVITDFGSLSIKNFATGNDGRAVTVYTRAGAVDSVDRQTRVRSR